MRLDRSTLVGAALGVLLLAGIVGFAVGLHEDRRASEPERVPIADTLPPALMNGSLKPLSQVLPQGAAANDADEKNTTARLTALFDVDAAFRRYAGPKLEPLVSLTVLDREPGLFLPDGPPAEPAPDAEKAGTTEMVRYGAVVCSVLWGSEQQLAEAGAPAKVQCQRGYAGRTFEIYASGLSPAEAAAALNEAIGHTQSVAAESQDQ